MNPLELATKIANWFREAYIPKFMNGQIEHGGTLTDMGTYQALSNLKDEMHDFVSYVYVLEKCLDEINNRVQESKRVLVHARQPWSGPLADIEEILNRRKED